MKKSAADSVVLFAVKKNATEMERVVCSDINSALRGNDLFLMEVLEYALFSGGKRLRPLLAIISSRLCGRDDRQLRLLAAAFEYLHVATLIHDDVIDHADKRRGRMSVVERYGMAAAILAGDWLHARSMHLIASLAGQGGLEIFCAATADMVDGEFLQMRYAGDPTVTEEQYFSVVIKKTAQLISSSCEIGALYGGGTASQVAALANYGQRIGIAFQIADDLLDYLGDEQATGKEVGNDFREGKMTLPLIHALNRGDENERRELSAVVQGDRTGKAYKTVQYLMEKAKSFAYARQRAEMEIKKGLSALSCFASEQRHAESLAVLHSLAEYTLRRDR